jgi:hypothetical protein
MSNKRIVLDKRQSFLRRIVREEGCIGQKAIESGSKCPIGGVYWTKGFQSYSKCPIEGIPELNITFVNFLLDMPPLKIDNLGN